MDRDIPIDICNIVWIIFLADNIDKYILFIFSRLKLKLLALIVKPINLFFNRR